jgi:hypothetical protein
MVFHRAMRRLIGNPRAATADSGALLSDLVYGWGNESWSGEPEFLLSCVEHALAAKEPILECGSGLTTMILGVTAQHTGNTLWTLEHLPEWGYRVQCYLDEFAITSVRLCVAPLAHYGECDWYAPPLEAMPERFDLVACDGPPSAAKGGRYGLASVMKGKLQQGCVILLDDAERKDEQDIILRWSEELPCRFSRMGATKPFFAAVVESRDRSPGSMSALRT